LLHRGRDGRTPRGGVLSGAQLPQPRCATVPRKGVLVRRDMLAGVRRDAKRLTKASYSASYRTVERHLRITSRAGQETQRDEHLARWRAGFSEHWCDGPEVGWTSPHCPTPDLTIFPVNRPHSRHACPFRVTRSNQFGGVFPALYWQNVVEASSLDQWLPEGEVLPPDVPRWVCGARRPPVSRRTWTSGAFVPGPPRSTGCPTACWFIRMGGRGLWRTRR
jgi:hypothetical protein